MRHFKIYFLVFAALTIGAIISPSSSSASNSSESSSFVGQTLHCSFERYVEVQDKIQTKICGDLNFDFPKPNQGVIKNIKGVGVCPELGISFDSQGDASNLVLGFYSNEPGATGSIAFTNHSSQIHLYGSSVNSFALDFNTQINGASFNYRARCKQL